MHPERKRGDVHRVLPQLVAGLGHLLHDVVRWRIRNHWVNQNRAATGHGDHVSVAMVRNLGDLQEEIERDGERRLELAGQGRSPVEDQRRRVA